MSISEYNALPEQIKNTINLETFESILSRGWVYINYSHEIHPTDEVVQKMIEQFFIKDGSKSDDTEQRRVQSNDQ